MRLVVLCGLVLGLAAGAPAGAQGLGGILPLPGNGIGLPGLPEAGGLGDPVADVGRTAALPPLDPAEGALNSVDGLARGALANLRRLTVQDLLRRHRRLVDADDQGQPVVRGEVLAITPAAATLAAAQAAGYRIGRRTSLEALGLDNVVLIAPRGVSTAQAVARLRRLDPVGAFEFNHLYQASGAVGRTAGGAPYAPRAGGGGGRLGLVDGSVAARHPSFQGVRLLQAAFGPGGAKVTDHATAVASLMTGSAGRFRGASPGAELFVADVYGPTAAGGSAEAIARGLAWLAQNRVTVVNISLVGPSNRLLQAAVAALVAQGRIVVAAVGNDGPAAPPLYPAAYPGVVGVSAVDARQRVLPEAARGPQVRFTAPGADMAAAAAGGGYVSVRGTSFAAPLVAGLLAREGARAVEHAAIDLGAPGPDPAYGLGLVAFDLRTEPTTVGARGQVRGR